MFGTEWIWNGNWTHMKTLTMNVSAVAQGVTHVSVNASAYTYNHMGEWPAHYTASTLPPEVDIVVGVYLSLLCKCFSLYKPEYLFLYFLFFHFFIILLYHYYFVFYFFYFLIIFFYFLNFLFYYYLFLQARVYLLGGSFCIRLSCSFRVVGSGPFTTWCLSSGSGKLWDQGPGVTQPILALAHGWISAGQLI